MWIGVGVRWEGGYRHTCGNGFCYPQAHVTLTHAALWLQRGVGVWNDFSAGWDCEFNAGWDTVRSGIVKWLQRGVGVWNDFRAGWDCEMTSTRGGIVKWLQWGVGLWNGLWCGGLCCCAELSAFLCDVPQAPYPWRFLQESLISQDFLYISIQKEHPYCSIVCLQLAVFSPILSHTTWSYG